MARPHDVVIAPGHSSADSAFRHVPQPSPASQIIGGGGGGGDGEPITGMTSSGGGGGGGGGGGLVLPSSASAQLACAARSVLATATVAARPAVPQTRTWRCSCTANVSSAAR